MIRRVPVQPLASVETGAETARVGRGNHYPAVWLQYSGHAAHEGVGVGNMLGHLVQGHIVEITRVKLRAVENSLSDVQTVTLCDGLDILVRLHPDRLAAPVPMIGQRGANAAANVQHLYIARHPAKRRAAV